MNSGNIRPHLAILAVLLAACQSMGISMPAETNSAMTLTQAPALTVPTLSSPASPEPDWYQPLPRSNNPLKFHYAQVTNPDARVYVRLQDAENENDQFTQLPVYPAYVSYVRKEKRGDLIYYKLATSEWMKGEDLQEVTPSPFTGILLIERVDFRFGWLINDTTSLDAQTRPVRSFVRYQVVREYPLLEEKTGFFAIGENEWLPEESLALVDPGMPTGVNSDICRFIHVDLAQQTLSAYENCQMVFATLISSGQEDLVTRPGVFAVIRKFEYRTLDSDANATDQYFLENVPYFMTYFGNLGLHGVYWHDQFGSPVSHGCINLSVTDARWLFDWVVLGNVLLISPGN